MGGLGGSSQQQQTQTTTQNLSPQSQQLFNLAFPKVASWSATVPERWPGPTVAPFNPLQQHTQEQLLQMVPQQAQVATRGILDAADLRERVGAGWNPDTMSFDVNKNSQLRGAIDAAQRPVWDQLMETTLPGIRDTGVMQGYGGSRQGIAEGLAISRADRNARDQASKIVQDLYKTNIDATGQRYGQNINALLGMAGLAPMQQQTLTAPYATMAQIGDVRQAQEQAQLAGDIGNWNYAQTAPFTQASDIIGLIHGFPSSTTTTANMPKTNPLMGALGGAATGAALGSAFPVVGTGVGAGLGGLAGLLFS